MFPYVTRMLLVPCGQVTYAVFRTNGSKTSPLEQHIPLWFTWYNRVISPLHSLVLKWAYPCEVWFVLQHVSSWDCCEMFMTVLWPLIFFTILTLVLLCRFSRLTDAVVLRTHPIKMRGSIAFLCCLAVASGFVLKLDDEVQWQAWKTFHGKAYSTESEEAARKAIWKDNLGVRNGSFCKIPA